MFKCYITWLLWERDSKTIWESGRVWVSTAWIESETNTASVIDWSLWMMAMRWIYSMTVVLYKWVECELNVRSVHLHYMHFPSVKAALHSGTSKIEPPVQYYLWSCLCHGCDSAIDLLWLAVADHADFSASCNWVFCVTQYQWGIRFFRTFTPHLIIFLKKNPIWFLHTNREH